MAVFRLARKIAAYSLCGPEDTQRCTSAGCNSGKTGGGRCGDSVSPEGTSGDGNRPLPFKTALFAAAARKADLRSVVVQPVSLAYTRLDGMPIGRSFRPFFSWYGTVGLMPHLWGMIGLGTVEAVVEFHPPTFLADCGSRKVLAGYCHARIAGGMASALFDRPQPMPGPPNPISGKLPTSASRVAA